MRKCSKCKIAKDLNETNFSKKNTGRDGFDSMCKQCKKDYDKKRYSNNKEKFRKDKLEYYKKHRESRKDYQMRYYNENQQMCKDSNNKWQKENPIKRRLINSKSRSEKKGLKSTLTEEEWLSTLKFFGNACSYCGMSERESMDTLGEHLHHEHLVPISQGGHYTRGNILPSCRSCNSSKGNKEFLEWYSSSDVYDSQRETKILNYVDMYLGVTVND